MRSLLLLLLLLYVVQRGVLSDSQGLESVKTRLINSIFVDYSKLVEPSHADLKFDLGFLCSWKTSPGSPLVASVVEKYMWTDRRLTWDPQHFDNILQLRLPDELIWKPDMKLYDALEATEHRESCNVDLIHNGTVIWFPRAVYKTFCNENPCQYNLGLWTYDALAVPVTLWGYEPANKYYREKNCPLHIQSVEVVKHTNFFPCCEAPYVYHQFNVTYANL